MRIYSFFVLLTSISLFVTVLSGVTSCKSDVPTEERVSEVEFRTDSSYFDYSVQDTFFRLSIPHLKFWKRDTIVSDQLERPAYILSHDSIRVAVIFSSHETRKPNSFNYYTKQHGDGLLDGELMDISNFLKDGQRLTQLILKNEEQFIFKIIYDHEVASNEVNIFIDKDQYNEENILLTESIIGQINFITK